jgi:hypothetical protein
MRTEGQTDMTKLIVAFRNFAKSAQNCAVQIITKNHTNTRLPLKFNTNGNYNVGKTTFFYTLTVYMYGLKYRLFDTHVSVLMMANK